jgi:hypothetical protein
MAMSESPSLLRERLVRLAFSGFRAGGYPANLIRIDYPFEDFLRMGSVATRNVPVAAFGQEVASYRSACWGVIASDADGTENVRRIRALGAPQILDFKGGYFHRWKVLAESEPVLLDRIPEEGLESAFRENKENWGPQAVLRSKLIAFDPTPLQLDFSDLGLMPVIESAVKSKLDRVLRDALNAARLTFAEGGSTDFRGLYQLIFRLVAAKVLRDRKHPTIVVPDDADGALLAVETLYGGNDTAPEPQPHDARVREVAWARIRDAFSFHHIPVEALAHVYEDTLVSEEQRRHSGTHATPPAVADYVVRRLPLERLPRSRLRVFEPFTGYGAFLLSAFARISELLPPAMQGSDRHQFLVERLKGIDQDPFAVEVAKLSLLLADYPNPNGWEVLEGDVFSDPIVAPMLEQSSVVLCNPPFGGLNLYSQDGHRERTGPTKEGEILRRVLAHRPEFLGFILPHSFVAGRSTGGLRRELCKVYRHIEVTSLPDNVFSHSQAPTVLLLAHDAKHGETSLLRTSEVRRIDFQQFLRTGRPSWVNVKAISHADRAAPPVLWNHPLDAAWKALAELPALSTLVDLHRGVEFFSDTSDGDELRLSRRDQQTASRGFDVVTPMFQQFHSPDFVALDLSPNRIRRGAHLLERFASPKVIVNAVRMSRGPWRLSAVPDRDGRSFTQNFHGLWPKQNSYLPIEVLSAILNSPVVNGFLYSRELGRPNKIATLKAVPMPSIRSEQMANIIGLVREYEALALEADSGSLRSSDVRLTRLLLEIDSEVLALYDLEPRMERELLYLFAGHDRPVSVRFDGYYPPGFRPALPLRFVISGEAGWANAAATLARLPVFDDPDISAVFSAINREGS